MDISRLLELHRFPEGAALIPIILYFPLGLTLAIIRLFISIHAFIIFSLLPKTWFIRSVILRFMFGVAGFIISTDGDENHTSARLVVSNHISHLDHIVTNLVLPHICLLDWNLSPLLQWLTGCQQIGAEKSKEEVIKFVKTVYNETKLPLLFFPEKSTTNGKIGLLKFWSMPFELGHTIQPVTIQAKRIGIFKISVSTATSPWWSDYFWCLFVPYTVFKLRYLPVTEKKETESCEEFAERVRHNMCKSLNVEATSFTHTDKTEYIKRQPTAPTPPTVLHNNSGTTKTPVSVKAASVSEKFQQPSRSSLSQISASPEVKAMVEQVKGVLPHVPVTAILSEIEKSGDVDVAITNILEGNIEFTPEEIPTDGSTADKNAKQIPCPSQIAFKANNFGNNSGYRQLSLEERKKAMYEMARRRYKEKHNML